MKEGKNSGPSNRRPHLPNNHALFIAKTGGGKSQMLSHVLPDSGVRVVGWDRAYAHKGFYFSNLDVFELALDNFIAANAKHFRIFYTGESGNLIADHEDWCRIVWNRLDGRKLTYAVDEELSNTCGSVANAKPEAAQLITEGRKYGLIHLGTTQRSQAIPKTIEQSSGFQYVGQQKTANIKRYADELDMAESEIRELKPLEFWKWDDIKAEKVRAIYREPVIDDNFEDEFMTRVVMKNVTEMVA